MDNKQLFKQLESINNEIRQLEIMLEALVQGDYKHISISFKLKKHRQEVNYLENEQDEYGMSPIRYSGLFGYMTRDRSEENTDEMKTSYLSIIDEEFSLICLKQLYDLLKQERLTLISTIKETL